jgi:(p)ppGpp synthase/HD superfamily hydrolase
MPDILSARLYEALHYAFTLHGRDSRQGSPVPVMAHLINVCAIVQQDGGSEDEAIAALLHDALEDKPEETSEDVIRVRFGENVVRMVRIASDTPPGWTGGPKPPWRPRKQGYLDRAATEPPELLRPTVADKIDNVRAILADHRRIGDEIWARFKAGKEEQLWYYASCYRAYEKAGASPTLLSDLRLLVEDLARALELPSNLGNLRRVDSKGAPIRP